MVSCFFTKMTQYDQSNNLQSNTIEKRKKIISKLEELRGSKILIYFCGDRPNLIANIHPEAVRWIYEHLLSMNKGDGVPIVSL